MRRLLAGLFILLVALGPAAACSDVLVPDNFVNELITSGLQEPTSMAFLPDWRVLVTQQHLGNIVLVNGSHLSFTTCYQVPDLVGGSYEQGLLGITVDPAWPQRPYIYIYYDASGTHCKVVRLTGSGDLDDPSSTHLVFGNPVVLLGNIPDRRVTNNGGCLRFGPDGMLYVSTGDDDDPCSAADSTSLSGAILRLRVNALEDNVAGYVTRAMITPYDNPLSTPDSNAKLVWAYGLRNPWRFNVDAVTGRIYAADPGATTYEELNEVLPGQFFGWPWREGPLVTARSACPEHGGSGANVFTGAIVNLLRDPTILVAFSTAGTYRPQPGASYNWPDAMNGDVFYGEYYSGDFFRMHQVDGVWQPADSLPGQPAGGRFASGMLSAVDFQIGPDGSLYYLTQYDSTLSGYGTIQRIRYVTPPPPLAVGDQAAGAVRFASAPNPFVGGTRFAFRLPQAARVQLDVYDLLGRRVRNLLDGEATAGEHTATWDGTDARGRALEPGVYLARLGLPGGARTLRIVRVN